MNQIGCIIIKIKYAYSLKYMYMSGDRAVLSMLKDLELVHELDALSLFQKYMALPRAHTQRIFPAYGKKH